MNACTICQHEKRADIDQALIAGTAYRTVATTFSLSAASLFRHRQKHVQRPSLDPSVANGAAYEADAKPSGEASAVLRDLDRNRRAAMRLLKRAEKSGEHRDMSQAISAATKALESAAKAHGVIKSGSQTVNVSQSQGLSVELHHQASQADPRTVLTYAGSVIGDGVLRSDPIAMRMVADLYALVQAQVSQPSTSQAAVEE